MLRTIPIKSILFKEELYPRHKYGWQTAYDYSESMKAGAKFPPIKVALYRNRYYLIDGKHRIEATKRIKKKTIQAEIVKNLNMNKILEKAIQSNVANGRPLSSYDKALNVQQLQKLGYSQPQISKIIQIPINKLTNFMADRLTNDITGEEVILKAPMKHYVGREISLKASKGQDKLASLSHLYLIDEVLTLFETKSMPRNNKTKEKLKVLYKYIQRFIQKGK